jgi:hypothetical protein
LALSGWRSLTGGGPWRCQLAERVGGVACGGAASSRDSSVRFDARIGRFPVGRVGHLRLALSGWRSLTGGATWRCQLAERLGGRVWRSHLAVSVGGPRWRTSLAVSPVAELGWSRNPSAHFDARIGRFPAGRGGHRQLALSDWWRNLAESVGGVSWRTRLADQVGGAGWRSGLAVLPVAVRLRAETHQ